MIATRQSFHYARHLRVKIQRRSSGTQVDARIKTRGNAVPVDLHRRAFQFRRKIRILFVGSGWHRIIRLEDVARHVILRYKWAHILPVFVTVRVLPPTPKPNRYVQKFVRILLTSTEWEFASWNEIGIRLTCVPFFFLG